MVVGVTMSKRHLLRQQGLSACSDIGNVKFRASDGTEITNEILDTAGYNIIQTA